MTAKRGVPGPDELDFGQAGLDDLVRALTAGPSPAELAGEREALAAFRTARAEQATPADPAARPGQGSRVPVPSATVPTTAGPSVPGPSAPRQAASWLAPGIRGGRPRGAVLRVRAGLATAAVAALATTIGAAYAEALPAAVQQAAYHVLGFAGVPGPGAHPGGQAGSGHGSRSRAGSPSGPGRSGSPGRTAPAGGRPGHGRSGSGKPAPGRPKHGGSGKPSPPPVAMTITIAARQAQVAAGTPATLSARARSGGHSVRGVRLSLQERPAGQTAWSDGGTVVTSPAGAATVRTAALAGNTSFRFADGSGDVSATVTVTVVLPVTVSAVQAHGKDHVAVAISAPLASPGDVVILQARSGGGWQDVRTRRLGQHVAPADVTLPRSFAGAQVRAVLPATSAHAASVSGVVTIPAP